MIVMERRRKRWAKDTESKLHGRRRHTPDESPPHPTRTPSDCDYATPDEVAAYSRGRAQPSQPATAQELRNQYVEHMIYPWARGLCLRIKTIRDVRRFDDYVDLLAAHAECTNHYEDEQQRLRDEDEIELPEDPREHYRVALSEWGRARHLRKIFRLTGTYPMDTGDMTTAEVYCWFQDLYAAVAAWEAATDSPASFDGDMPDFHNAYYGYESPSPGPTVPQVRFVEGESLPGKSSGKPRKYMSVGNGENANGVWDNIVRGMED